MIGTLTYKWNFISASKSNTFTYYPWRNHPISVQLYLDKIVKEIEYEEKLKQLEQDKRNEIYNKYLVSRTKSSILSDFLTYRF
jgi:hypothetical protein